MSCRQEIIGTLRRFTHRAEAEWVDEAVHALRSFSDETILTVASALDDKDDYVRAMTFEVFMNGTPMRPLRSQWQSVPRLWELAHDGAILGLKEAAHLALLRAGQGGVLRTMGFCRLRRRTSVDAENAASEMADQ